MGWFYLYLGIWWLLLWLDGGGRLSQLKLVWMYRGKPRTTRKHTVYLATRRMRKPVMSRCFPCHSRLSSTKQTFNIDVGDNNGWPHLFDKYFGMPSYNTGTKSNVCLLGVVPELCLCRDLELDCDGAQLQDIPVVAMNVTMMSLQRNRLQKLRANTFFKYQNLQKLYLQHNRIRDVSPDAFRGLYNLTRLYLSYNKISVLMPGVFKDLHKLEWLVLQRNRISHIHEQAFSILQKLGELDLSNNRLVAIPPNLFVLLGDLLQLKSMQVSPVELALQ
ncbi:hypothetical protein PAMP_023082 [Pampus punctatissimus]